MGGIVFPDFIGTIAKVEAIDNSQRQSAWLDEDRASKKAAAPFVQKALQGDPGALNEVATRHPDTAMKIAPLLERMDAGKRAKLKEDADFITQNGMAILNSPPEQQPQLYARVRQEAQAKGRDVSSWPTQYDPGWVDFEVKKAMPIAEHLKRSGEGVTFAPPAGGGAAPSGPANVPQEAIPKGQQFVRYLTEKHGLPPVAAAGVVGGLFQESGFNPNAVGDGGTAGGMGQWRLDRRENLIKFAQSQGKQPNDPTVQIDYLVSELKGGDPGAQQAYALLQQAKTPQEATTAMMHFFRPAGYTSNNPQGGHGYGNRVQYAQRFMPDNSNAVPMPQPPPGMAVPGNPAQMPSGPPGIAQGDNPGRGDGSGNPVQPPPQALAPLRGLQIPPGARVALQGGVPIVKDGNVLYLDANGGWGAAPLPKPKEPTEPNLLHVDTGDSIAMVDPKTGNVVQKIPKSLKPGEAQVKEAASNKQTTEQANKLRDDFRQEPPVKSYRVVVPMLESAKDAATRPNRAADINLVYAFAKLMDPDSVVRESETGMVQASGTVADKLSGLLGQLNGNAMLLPATRQKLLAELDSRFKSLEESYTEIAKAYESIAKSNGVDPTHVILPVRRAKTQAAAAPTDAAPAGDGPPTPPAANSADRGRLIFDAKSAIARGAPAAAVQKELKDKYGIDLQGSP